MDDNKEVIVPQKALDTLPPRHLKFLVEYLKLGNGTQAYMKVYRVKNRTVAASGAWKILNKYKDIKKHLYEVNGLDEKAMIDTIKDALSAEKMIVDKLGFEHNSPDHFIRLKAVEIRNKALGEDVSTTQRGGNTLNVIIQKDKAKGLFSMAEEGEIIE